MHLFGEASWVGARPGELESPKCNDGRKCGAKRRRDHSTTINSPVKHAGGSLKHCWIWNRDRSAPIATTTRHRMNVPTALNSFVINAGALCTTGVEEHNISSDVSMTTMESAWIMEMLGFSLLFGQLILNRMIAMVGERDHI